MNDKEKIALLYGLLSGMLFWENLTEDQRYMINSRLNMIEQVDE